MASGLGAVTTLRAQPESVDSGMSREDGGCSWMLVVAFDLGFAPPGGNLCVPSGALAPPGIGFLRACGDVAPWTSERVLVSQSLCVLPTIPSLQYASTPNPSRSSPCNVPLQCSCRIQDSIPGT